MAEEQRVELWGFMSGDVERVRGLLERTLGVAFALYESESIGPYYFAPYCEPHADLTLRPNLDAAYEADSENPDAFAEPDFPDFPVVLYVDWRTTSHACRDRLQGLAQDAQLLMVEE